MAEDDEKNGERKPGASGFQLWVAENWEGWLKQVGLMALLLAAYLVYKFDLISESVAGTLAVLALLTVAFLATALPARALVRSSLERRFFYLLTALWLGGTAYPPLRATLRPAPLGEVQLTATKKSQTLDVPKSGPFEVVVRGQFAEGRADAEARYHLTVAADDQSEEVEGALKREVVRLRVGRRGGSTQQLQQHTEENHLLRRVRGTHLAISVDEVDAQLLGGLTVVVHKGPLPNEIFLSLSVIALLLALYLDGTLTDTRGKAKSYLTVGVGVLAVFAHLYPQMATSHNLVSQAISEGVRAGLVGGLGGWLCGVIARVVLRPKTKKT